MTDITSRKDRSDIDDALPDWVYAWDSMVIWTIVGMRLETVQGDLNGAQNALRSGSSD